jgi:GNAT superfamily N-acetyltransferase
MSLSVEIAEDPPGRDLRLIEQGLIDHAGSRGIEPRNHRPLTVFLRDDEGRIVGGLVGMTVWGWLQVSQLWVLDELRGRGHGSALMHAAEAEAVRRGCHHALLDTFDFQARAFYERLGYTTFGAVEDFPRGHTRFFLQKRFQDRPA